MEIVKQKKLRAAHVVYVQFRQSTRQKDGRMKITATKTRTISDATIAEVETILMQAIAAA